MRDPKLPVASEHDEQVALFDWAKLMIGHLPEIALLFAVPNGARTSIHTAKKLKAEGLRAGVPDVWFPVARGQYHGMVIEMKRCMGGQLSREQKGWIEALRKQGYYVVVCPGWDLARQEIEQYLKLVTS